ncbi:TetR-like C-terminal domain-containing protein, partial [Microbacterium azadirachtae]|uniref:TetR-like C-terminal domain-containing protein n=1 Tax=Microbacterium azadirachtae TaxID=582680 RepID=UPI003F7512F9
PWAVSPLFARPAELTPAVAAPCFGSWPGAPRAAEPGGLRALGEAYRSWALQHPDRYRLMFSGAVSTEHDPADHTGELDALLPLARTLTGAAEVGPDVDLRSTLAVWAQVHGAVGLELAGVAPPWVDADAVYAAVLDAIAAVHPGH